MNIYQQSRSIAIPTEPTGDYVVCTRGGTFWTKQQVNDPNTDYGRGWEHVWETQGPLEVYMGMSRQEANAAADRLEESFNAFIWADAEAAIEQVKCRNSRGTEYEVERLQQAANDARWAHVAEIRRVLGADPHRWEQPA